MQVYIDVHGQMYADTAPHSANDLLVPNVSAALLAQLTTTPVDPTIPEAAAAIAQEDTGPNATDSGAPI